MQPPSDSRYARVSRRNVLRSAAGIGLAALVPGLAACGDNDAGVLANAADSSSPSTTGAQTTTSSAPETIVPSSAEQSVDTTPESTEPGSGRSGLPVGTELVVDFTYSPGAQGKNLPPYVAVWVEDADGNLVDTIALWYQQSGKGQRWLRDLKRWFSADQDRINAGGQDVVDIVSSATRLAGSYSLTWDGTAADGSPVGAGDYFIAIESTREHGPYSLILEPLTLTGEAVGATPMTDQGELVSASIASV